MSDFIFALIVGWAIVINVTLIALSGAHIIVWAWNKWVRK